MKRLFRIGIGLMIYSIIPILSWIVLSLVLKDDRIANVFSLTYSIQFIWAILKYLFGSGANIRKEKENDNNAVWNSIFWGVIFSILIFTIVLIFVEDFIAFFGQDVSFYKPFVIYAILLLFLQSLLSLIIEKLYFEDKEKTANKHLLAFSLLSFILPVGLSLIIPNTFLALMISIGLCSIYIVILYIVQFEKFKIKFNFLKNFKYESTNILNSLLMLIIYLFGYKIVFSTGAEYLLAINIIALCTDTQWDMLTAISTTAKVDISKNRYEYKKEVKNAYFYSLLIIMSSIIMTFIVCLFNDVVPHIILICLILEIVDMIMYPYILSMRTFTQLEYSVTLNTTLNLVVNILRTILSVVIFSPYCTILAQVICSALEIITFIIIRIVKYKVVDGKLTLKNKVDYFKSRNQE